MKPERLLSILSAVWVLIIGIDGLLAALRACYVRRMKNPFRAVYGGLGYGKMVMMIVLAVINILMLSRDLHRDRD